MILSLLLSLNHHDQLFFEILGLAWDLDLWLINGYSMDILSSTQSGWWFQTWILFSIIYGIILPIDFHIFQRGRYTTNQLWCYENITVIITSSTFSIHGCQIYIWRILGPDWGNISILGMNAIPLNPKPSPQKLWFNRGCHHIFGTHTIGMFTGEMGLQGTYKQDNLPGGLLHQGYYTIDLWDDPGSNGISRK